MQDTVFTKLLHDILFMSFNFFGLIANKNFSNVID